jgi:hypothetical protein
MAKPSKGGHGSAPTQQPMDGRTAGKPADKGQVVFGHQPGGTKGTGK